MKEIRDKEKEIGKEDGEEENDEIKVKVREGANEEHAEAELCAQGAKKAKRRGKKWKMKRTINPRQSGSYIR